LHAISSLAGNALKQRNSGSRTRSNRRAESQGG
jgi:hypothetical protein